jgi:hypothetical protein
VRAIARSAPVAAFALAALLLAGPVPSAAPPVTPIAWNQRVQGLPFLTVGTDDVWINAITTQPDQPKVWHVDPVRAAATPTRIVKQVDDVFPGGSGSLWVSSVDMPSLQPTVSWVDVAGGYRLVEKNVPANCELEDGGHGVVVGGQLWFNCMKYGIYVFATDEREPVRRVPLRSVSVLLASRDGIWAAAGGPLDGTGAAAGGSLRGLSGRARGRTIALPRGFTVAGDYASNVGWAVAGTTIWAIGHEGRDAELVRFDLNRQTATAFPIVAPVGADGYLGGGIAVTSGGIWVGDGAHVRLIRYARNHPKKPVGYLAMPGSGHAKDAFFSVQAGAGALWVEAERPDGFHMFRVATG